MTEQLGFNCEQYLAEQSREIEKRIDLFNGKLYLEFGGKLLFDYHACRVLPGYQPNIKIELLKRLRNKIEIILCIHAGDIEKGRIRGDFGVTYDVDALKLIDDLRNENLEVCAVVITRFNNQSQVKGFQRKLEHRGVKVYLHESTKGYPTDVDTIVSEEGYGRNKYIATTKPVIVVTGPGPGSGKLATCLSQLYHDYKKGIRSGYAKFETFPIWNLSLKHPVNVAYEAATADLRDVNMIDPFHLNAYGISATNYSRDVEIFPVVQRILKKIMGKKMIYQSPTDMGVNKAGFAIIDDALVQQTAKQELIRRYFRHRYEYLIGVSSKETLEKVILLMEEIGLKPEDRAVVKPARKKMEELLKKEGNGIPACGAAIELQNKKIITGKNNPLMSASSSCVLNAIKTLAEIPERIDLLPAAILENIATMKRDILSLKQSVLDLQETLIALSISASSNPTAAVAMEQLKSLSGCDMHLTHVPAPGDEVGLRKLRVYLTTDGLFPTKDLNIS
ncbi:MAG: DUF1846 domain-containing protein [Candidatus Ratteibacteria bacterium]|jgi:uncharacterized protein (UPF0371 family)